MNPVDTSFNGGMVEGRWYRVVNEYQDSDRKPAPVC